MTDDKIREIAYGHGMIAGPGMNPPSEEDAIEFAEAIIAQARAEWVAGMHAYADRQYCIGMEQLRRPDCLGWEYKAKHGQFGEAEFKAHADANKAFGAHFGIYAAINSIPTTKEGHEDQ
jgi:hypothetical protein